MRIIYFFLLLASVFISCEEKPKSKIGFYGHPQIINGDTSHHTVPAFSFINQDSVTINNKTFHNQYYIVDYFFTSCPTICPKVKQQTLRINNHFGNRKDLAYLSVSIDTRTDTVLALNKYKKSLEIDNPNWHFVTGTKEMIYGVAEGFFHVAEENEDAPGGFDHDGKLILISPEGNIRTFCDGTDPLDVDRFISDVSILID